MTERFPGPQVLLACERCHRRKVKCDKQTPCSKCERLGIVCVPVRRARFPRGRVTQPAKSSTVGSDSALTNRVNELEKQLLKLATGDPGISSPLDATGHRPLGPSDEPQPVDKPLLSGQTDRAELTETQKCDRNVSHTQKARTPPFGPHLAISTYTDKLNTENPIPEIKLSPQTRRDLGAIYFYNVDPLFKILHRPSVQSFLYEGQRYLKYELHDHAPNTLAAAIYYCALCSMEESQYTSLFSEPRETMVAQLQRETEVALLKADCTTSNDLTILQAYVLFLLATWTHDKSRRVWTMLSMALRMAQALSLHMAQPPFETTPFEQEMRRRLWLAIGLLDVSAALSHASEPMMQATWLESHPPSNINDEDISIDTQSQPASKDVREFTDMTFSFVVFEAQNTVRSIGFSGWAQSVIENPALRQQLIHQFRTTVSRLLIGCKPDTEPFHRFAHLSARTMNSWLQLISIRPLRASKSFIYPAIQGDGVLRLTADNLQAIMEGHHDPRVSSWRWFDCMWTPWHGLAVAMAELCTYKELSVMERYWPLVDTVYAECHSSLDDTQSCRVRKPMEKLYSHIRIRRDDMLREQSIAVNANDTAFDEILSTIAEPQNFPSLSFGLAPTSGFYHQHQPDSADTVQDSLNFLDLVPNIWDEVNFNETAIDNEMNTWQSYEDFIIDFQNAV
ncbi:unnamed protein product [Penicillium olsonii]|nr:unnamed protein product [Penicillium olsonii]CAG7930141.1 unnamed protein product [Penicillium olsonii]